ncbi:MAG TPA: transporter substrate-binding domain-containing protein [Candidatus Limnocylindrales bacterium]|nr:transporter substrate-binding domain-containing protein [Candidatus Limnocylindrales bacterium]
MRRIAALAILGLLAACSGTASSPAAPTADPAKDKLAQVLARGTLVLWTDLEYPPQSFAVEGATRAAETKCTPNQLTGPEVSGYDAETGKLVAAAMGLEPCFVSTPFDSMIGGSWGDRFDVAWASGAITVSRMETLYVTQPYYSTPATFFVGTSSSVTKPEELSGKEIGACSGCTHDQYLRRTLELPGATIDWLVDDPQIVTYNQELPGLEDTANGEIDAFLCSEPVGLGAIKDGAALRELETPAYYTQKSGYIDRDLALDPKAFIDRISAEVSGLHAAGKLKALSQEFFGSDYATPAGSFDLSAVGQTVP